MEEIAKEYDVIVLGTGTCLLPWLALAGLDLELPASALGIRIVTEWALASPASSSRCLLASYLVHELGSLLT